MSEMEKWFLSLPKDIKLQMIKDMGDRGEHMEAMETAKILLDAPISEGGVSTDDIKEVWGME